MPVALTGRERRALLLVIAIVVGARLATLGAYPLMDSTESRYAEIARKMLETGDWLMPQFDYGVPFWGKPPLSTWLAALSMAVFGINAFAARLPSLIVVACCGALVYALANLRGGRDQALWSLALFATTGLVFVAAGGVMTDPALVLGTTLAMAGFWIAVEGPERARRAAGAAFFAGLAIGLLAKGPVAAILIFVPVAGAILWSGTMRIAWRRLPWLLGTAAAAAVTLAWYWAAERASPGFLAYFLIGEHWKRFVEPGWSGDLYGTAHSRVRGMIWPFFIVAALPWSVGALGWLVHAARRPTERLSALVADRYRIYLLLWTLTPMLFFTPAGNILVTYVLPGLPAFALLVGDLWSPGGDARVPNNGDVRGAVRRVLVAGLATASLFVVGIAVLHRSFDVERSQVALVRDYERASSGADSTLVYFRQRPHSAEFYTAGRARKVTDAAALERRLDDAAPDYYAIREPDLAALPGGTRARLTTVGTYGEYRLLRAAPR